MGRESSKKNMKNTIIIAEAGVNHNGDIELAKQLIDAAAEAEVDYVKFQTFKASKLVTRSSKKAAYQIKNDQNASDTQFEMLKALELTDEMHSILIEYCKDKGVNFLSTGFDLDSLEYLQSKGIKLAKVPSGELTNLPYLRTIASLFDTIILSTGMATLDEVKDAFNVLISNGINKDNITILHCNTEYPTPMEDVNLLAMLDIKNTLGVAIGYSDHTLGIEVPIAAVALGAKVIEKHFTLDRALPGPDHKASLEPGELIAMVKGIRNIEKAISGNRKKEPSRSELKNRPIARKSLVALKEINKGEILTKDNVGVKRPGTGISPMRWDQVIGTKAILDFKIDDLIRE